MNFALAVEQAVRDEGGSDDTARRIRERFLATLAAEQPNRQVFNAGLILCETAAPMTTRAVSHIANVINGNDGYPSATMGDGSRSSDATSVTERAALHAVEDGSDGGRKHEVYLAKVRREDIRDLRHAIVTQIRDYVRLLGYSLPQDDRKQIAMLCDGQGFEGAELPWLPNSRDERNGWHDPTCVDMADESKLCPKCKIRERRWRARNGLEPRKTNMPEPAGEGRAA